MKVVITQDYHISLKPAGSPTSVNSDTALPLNLWLYVEVTVDTSEVSVSVLTLDSEVVL